MVMTPPLAPRRLSWAIAGRVAGKVLQGFMLALLVALVAWPERHGRRTITWYTSDGSTMEIEFRCEGELTSVMTVPQRTGHVRWVLDRNADLSLLPDLLGM